MLSSIPISGYLAYCGAASRISACCWRVRKSFNYTHLYGLTRDELSYILDTFPIVRRKDEARWGEYRTKRLVLSGFDNCARVPCVQGSLASSADTRVLRR